MGIPERIYRIGKAYINQIRDRVDEGLDKIDDRLADAERELSSEPGATAPSLAEDTSPEGMMRRAEERIAAARRNLESRTELRGETANATTATATVDPATKPTTATNNPNESDYKMLGVPIGADLPTIQAAYEKLALRCDPRRFPDGSVEQQEAQKILARINVSYEALRRRLDPTESRFGKLELE